MKQRVPLGLLLLLPAFVYWLSFLIGEGVGIGTARDLFAVFSSTGTWGFIVGMVICPAAAVSMSVRDFLREKGSKALDGWVILLGLLFLIMALSGLLFRASQFI